MIRKMWMSILIVLCMVLPFVALAETSLEARRCDNGIIVQWSTSDAGDATLTVYNNGWPVLVTSVRCADGRYTVPAAYANNAGSYSVRLRTDSGCLTANVSDSRPADTPVVETPTQKPTEVPSSSPVQPSPRPTAVPSAAPTAGGSVSNDLAAEVVAQVNQERAVKGLSTLSVDAELTAAARTRAQEIAQSFSHTRPNGSSWSTVSTKARGENIAAGQNTADKVMAAWMSSTSHRDNILRPSFGSIGVCALKINGVIYWVQLFGN